MPDQHDNLTAPEATAAPGKTRGSLLRRRPASSREPHEVLMNIMESLHIRKRFDTPFIIGSVKLRGPSEVAGYISGAVRSKLGDDYYYGYTFSRSGQLNFIAMRSGEHIAGDVSVFARAFLHPGRYVFHRPESSAYHYIVHDEEGRVSETLGHELHPGYEELTLKRSDLKELMIPKSFFFAWSLQPKVDRTLHWSAAALVVAIVFFGLTQWLGIQARASQQAELPHLSLPSVTRGLPDLMGPIWEVSSRIRGLGMIERAEVTQADTSKMQFVVRFTEPQDAQGFIARNPAASLQDGGVQLSIPLAKE